MVTERPNILWFSFEDTSPRFGCYGDALARDAALTPNVDRLAAAGRLYRKCYSTAPVCAPSRFAVITGVYAHTAGAQHMRTTHTNRSTPGMCTPYEVVPPPQVKCIGEYLRARGYWCTNNVKTDYQFVAPASAWDECAPTAHWRNRPDPNQPFFAVFNYDPTHESGMWAEKGDPRTDPRRVEVPPHLVDGPEARRCIARQYDHIADGDARLGQLLEQLEADGVLDNTIIFIWSDHGEGLPRKKRWPLDGGTRVPMIVHAGRRARQALPPAQHDPAVIDDLVSLIALPATVLALTHTPRPPHLQGRAFLGHAKSSARRYAFSTRDRYDESYDRVRSVRDARWRYVRNYHPELPYLLWIPYSFRHPAMHELWQAERDGTLTPEQSLLMRPTRPVEELYDLDNDPHELHNLADNPNCQQELKRLRRALDAFLRRYGDRGEEPEAEMVARMWPGGVQPRTQPPVFIPITPDLPGIQATIHEAEPISLAAPARVMIHCPTQGASLTCTTGERWTLYTQPLVLPPGTTTLRARAHRYGYADSAEVVVSFIVTAGECES
ncbi:MAG TPA: sulfatase [Tepidisphaeraceae bacterium]|nr:sulfatase [Tepidisphaeraceae bacterium]